MLREDSQLEQKQFELYKQLRTLKSTLLNDITRKCTKLMDTLLVLLFMLLLLLVYSQRYLVGYSITLAQNTFYDYLWLAGWLPDRRAPGDPRSPIVSATTLGHAAQRCEHCPQHWWVPATYS